MLYRLFTDGLSLTFISAKQWSVSQSAPLKDMSSVILEDSVQPKSGGIYVCGHVEMLYS